MTSTAYPHARAYSTGTSPSATPPSITVKTHAPLFRFSRQTVVAVETSPLRTKVYSSARLAVWSLYGRRLDDERTCGNVNSKTHATRFFSLHNCLVKETLAGFDLLINNARKTGNRSLKICWRAPSSRRLRHSLYNLLKLFGIPRARCRSNIGPRSRGVT